MTIVKSKPSFFQQGDVVTAMTRGPSTIEMAMLPEALRSLKETQPPVTFFGHTHIQGGFMFASDDAATIKPVYQSKNESEHFDFQLDRKCHYLINPGSVGQPRDGNPEAAYAIFDGEEFSIHFKSVPYDIPGAQRRILDAGLPPFLAERLAQGV